MSLAFITPQLPSWSITTTRSIWPCWTMPTCDSRSSSARGRCKFSCRLLVCEESPYYLACFQNGRILQRGVRPPLSGGCPPAARGSSSFFKLSDLTLPCFSPSWSLHYSSSSLARAEAFVQRRDRPVYGRSFEPCREAICELSASGARGRG